MLLIALYWVWIAAVSLGLGLARGIRATCGKLPELLTPNPELLSVSRLAVLVWLIAWGSFIFLISLAMQLGLSALAGSALSPAAPPGRWPAFQQTVNSFYLLLLTLYHVRRAGQALWAGARPWLAGFYLGSLLLVLLVLRPWISSPLPDSTVATLGLLLIGVLLEKSRLPLSGLVWLTILMATAVTFKAAAAAFLLWPLAGALRRPAWQWQRGLSLLAGVGLLVLLPWLGRNVALSDYLAYPLAGSLGPLVREWAIPAKRLAADLAEIRLFARRPLPDWPLAAPQSVRQWFRPWWQQQALADKGLFILVLAGMTTVIG